jgi:hypothetical protein
MVTSSAAFAANELGGPSTSPASAGTERAAPVTPVGPVIPAGAQTSSVVLPSAADAAEIAVAVRTSPFTSEVSPDSYDVTGTKLAGSDPSWALTELRPRVADLDRAVGVLHETDGHWVLLQLGSFEVGCDITPTQVREDLDIICPPPPSTPIRNA